MRDAGVQPRWGVWGAKPLTNKKEYIYVYIFLIFIKKKFQTSKNWNLKNFKSVQISVKDAEWAETNEKSIFRFLRLLVFLDIVIYGVFPK